MANRGSFKNNLTTYDFEFDEGLESKVRAKLVVEIIKYLLYQRQQLPMVLDQLKRHISVTTDTETVMYWLLNIYLYHSPKYMTLFGLLDDIYIYTCQEKSLKCQENVRYFGLWCKTYINKGNAA